MGVTKMFWPPFLNGIVCLFLFCLFLFCFVLFWFVFVFCFSFFILFQQCNLAHTFAARTCVVRGLALSPCFDFTLYITNFVSMCIIAHNINLINCPSPLFIVSISYDFPAIKQIGTRMNIAHRVRVL